MLRNTTVRWAVFNRLMIIGTPCRKFSTRSPTFYEQCRFWKVKIRSETVRFNCSVAFWPSQDSVAYIDIWLTISSEWKHTSISIFLTFKTNTAFNCMSHCWKNKTVFAKNVTVPDRIFEKENQQSSYIITQPVLKIFREIIQLNSVCWVGPLQEAHRTDGRTHSPSYRDAS